MNSPEPLLTVLRSDLFCRFVRMTAACGISAPVESCTMPDTLPVVSCAITGDRHSSRPAIKNITSAAAGLILGNDVIVTTSRWFPSVCPGCTPLYVSATRSLQPLLPGNPICSFAAPYPRPNPARQTAASSPRKRLIPHQCGDESQRHLTLVQSSGDIDIMKAPALI